MSGNTTLWIERASWGIAGLFWIVWLSYEDRSIHTVIVVAAVIATASGVTIYRKLALRWPSKSKSHLGLFITSGGLAGLLVALLGAILMLVKVSLHSHGTPDFTPSDLSAVLRTIPAWLSAGLLLGLAAGLTVRAHKP